MDFNFDDLLNNNDLTDNNLSIEGMEDFRVDIPTQDISEQINSDHAIGTINYLDDSGGGSETAYGSSTTYGLSEDGGGSETAYGSSTTYGLFEDGGGSETAYGSSTTYGLFEDGGDGDSGGSGGTETIGSIG